MYAYARVDMAAARTARLWKQSRVAPPPTTRKPSQALFFAFRQTSRLYDTKQTTPCKQTNGTVQVAFGQEENLWKSGQKKKKHEPRR